MILNIVQIPEPVLRKNAKPVLKIDKRIVKLVSDMTETLKNLTDPKGVGLAAPQVGVSLRLFVVDINGKIVPFVNPEIIECSKEKALDGDQERKHFLEGCLSLRKVYGFVNRHKWIKIRFQDLNGKTHIKTYKGRIAEYIQHETDHLNGTIFIDHTLKDDYKVYRVQKDQEGKEVFREVKDI